MSGPVFMNFPITATSHSLADYRARGGYAALEKALRELTPAQVGAAGEGLRPAGPRRRGLPDRPQVGVRLQGGAGRLPLLQRRRRRARHLQGPLDPRAFAAPAARRHAARLLLAARAARLRLHPRRVRPAAAPPAGRAGGSAGRRPRRREHPRQRLRLRHRHPPRRRRLRLRRGIEPDQLARRQEGLPAQQAAVPRREGPVPEAHGRQQRRDAGHRALDHGQRRRAVRRDGREEDARHAALRRLGSRREAGPVRKAHRLPARRSSSARTPAASSVDGSSRPSSRAAVRRRS